MADEILNPGDRESLSRLLAGLKELDANLTKQIVQGGDQTRQEIARTRAQAAREARSRPTTQRPAAEPARQAEGARAQAGAEERVARARRESGRLLVVESRASRDRLSAAERVLQAERDIASARARRLQQVTRAAVGPIDGPNLQRQLEETLRKTGLYTPTAAPRRSTISDEELLRRRELLTPPPPPPPRQPPTGVAGFPEPDDARRRGISLSEVIGGQQRAASPVDRLAGLSAADAEAYDRALKGGSRSAAEFDRELQRLTRTQALSGDQMRRHGLLTTEFLAAAADGRTTISELGVQIGGTIAKFAGWTLAASATYGALAALQQLGQGAIESLNGVTSLQRVVQNLNTEQAQEQFRSLAHEFNLPISDVTAASFEAAKAFRDQADMAEATKAALVGVKVGEIEAGEAARFVTAIYRGFHLEVGELNDVMDVANQLQNRFGADFKGTAAGVAQAAGSFGAAGGSFRELAAMVATIQLTTGRTGPEAGTALRRTAEIIGRPERRQTIIDVLGIDPRDKSVTEVIQRAMEEVSKGGDPGAIARAITTPELASGRIIPLLQAQQQYLAALRETQKDRSGGSAERELDTVLGSIGEKAKRLGVTLQTVGSSLAESGALDGAVLLLDTLNLTLKTTESLLDLFGELPRPLRQGLVIAAQLMGTLALLRRFNVGQAFATGGILNRTLSRDPQRMGRAQVIQGLRDERDFIVNERERVSRDATRSTYAASQQRGRLDTLLAAGDDSPEHARSVARAQQRLERFEQQAAEAVEDQADLAQRHRDIVVRENEFRRRTTRRGGETVQSAGRDLGIFYGSDIQPRPDPNAPIPILGVPGDEVGREARLREQAQSEYRRVQQEMARTGRSRAFTTGAASLAAGSAAARGVASGAKNLAGALAASLGPLEVGVLAVLTIFETYQQISGQIKDTAQRLNAIETATGIEDLRTAAKVIREQAAGPGGLQGALEDVQDVFADVWNEVDKALGGGGVQIESPQQRREAAGRQAQREVEALRRANEKGVGLTRQQIEARFKSNLRGGMDPDEALAQAEKEAGVARGILTAPDSRALQRAQEDVRAFKERIRNYRKTIGDVDKTYGAGLSLEELTGANAIRIFTRGADRQVIRATGEAIAKARRELATSNDPEQQAQIIQQIQAAQQAVEQELTGQFQRRLSLSTGPGQSGRLRRQYVDQMRALVITPLRKQVREAERGSEDARRELDREQEGGAAGDPSVRGAQGPERLKALTDRQDRIKQLRARIRGGSERAKRLRQQLKREEENFDLLEREQSRAQFQERTQLFAARTSRLQSETADPLAQARIMRQRSAQNLARMRAALKRGDTTQVEVENAIAEHNRALQQLASAAVARFQASQGLSAAQYNLSNLGNEGGKLSFAISQAQSLVGFIAGQGDKLGPDELINAQRAVFEARAAYSEFIFQQQREMVQAQAELQLARTGDNPIREANIRVREAEQLQRFARTPAERVRAQAEVIGRRRDRQTTIYREQLATIDFEADIGRIDRDVQIRRLEQLLSTIKGNRDLRREIRRRIYQLKQDLAGAQEVSLDVGSIRLPTTYEIRRAIKGGLDSGRQVMVTNQLGGVVVNGGDPDAVVERIEQAFATSTSSAMRSAGV